LNQPNKHKPRYCTPKFLSHNTRITATQGCSISSVGWWPGYGHS